MANGHTACASGGIARRIVSSTGVQVAGASEASQQTHSAQEAAPAEAPVKEQEAPQADEPSDQESLPSTESPEQPQQIRRGVQVLLAVIFSSDLI